MNKRKSNYIYIEMRHKMLIVGVIIIHVCFMLIGASGIISGLCINHKVIFDYLFKSSYMPV